jgi:hypothetical protein
VCASRGTSRCLETRNYGVHHPPRIGIKFMALRVILRGPLGNNNCRATGSFGACGTRISGMENYLNSQQQLNVNTACVIDFVFIDI